MPSTPAVATDKQSIPTKRADHSIGMNDTSNPKSETIRKTLPRTKLGMVFAAVERILVPNCSAAIVTKMAQ